MALKGKLQSNVKSLRGYNWTAGVGCFFLPPLSKKEFRFQEDKVQKAPKHSLLYK